MAMSTRAGVGKTFIPSGGMNGASGAMSVIAALLFLAAGGLTGRGSVSWRAGDGVGAGFFFAYAVSCKPPRAISFAAKPTGSENESLVGRLNAAESEERRQAMLGMPSEIWLNARLAPSWKGGSHGIEHA